MLNKRKCIVFIANNIKTSNIKVKIMTNFLTKYFFEKFKNISFYNDNKNTEYCYFSVELYNKRINQSLYDILEENYKIDYRNSIFISLDMLSNSEANILAMENIEVKYIKFFSLLDEYSMQSMDTLKSNAIACVSYIDECIKKINNIKEELDISKPVKIIDKIDENIDIKKDINITKEISNCLSDNNLILKKEELNFLNGYYAQIPFKIKNDNIEIYIYPDNQILPKNNCINLHYSNAIKLANILAMVEGSVYNIIDEKTINNFEKRELKKDE